MYVNKENHKQYYLLSPSPRLPSVELVFKTFIVPYHFPLFPLCRYRGRGVCQDSLDIIVKSYDHLMHRKWGK